MTYKLPLNDDGTVDLTMVDEDIWIGPDRRTEILQALVDHTLESAAKVADKAVQDNLIAMDHYAGVISGEDQSLLDGAKQEAVNIAEFIRALKTKEPDDGLQTPAE